MPDRLYILDASAIMFGWKEAYQPEAFEQVWERIAELASDGSVVSCMEVFEEIDWPVDLIAWCEERKDLFEPLTLADIEKWNELQPQHPSFKPKGGKKKWADPWLITKCKLNAHKNPVIVTEERKQGQSDLPYVLNQEGIDYINILEFVNEIMKGP